MGGVGSYLHVEKFQWTLDWGEGAAGMCEGISQETVPVTERSLTRLMMRRIEIEDSEDRDGLVMGWRDV